MSPLTLGLVAQDDRKAALVAVASRKPCRT